MAQDPKDYEGHFANYTEYSKTFRSWMVAYGIGGPILLLISKDAPQTIAKSPNLKLIVLLFIVGVAAQIILALVNKWAAWQMYKGTFAEYQEEQADSDGDNHHKSRTFRIWKFINNQSWFDFLCDVAALGVFSYATWLALNALLSASI